jgi:predicted permease
MAWFRRGVAGFAGLFRKDRADRELDDELRAFLEASIEQKTHDGMARDAAVRAARVEMGSLEAVKDHTRDVGWETRVDSVYRDVRFAIRMLGRSPVFTIVAVLTLALGIGANVAVFTLVDAVVLRPLPLHQPDRLVMLSESHIQSGQQRVGLLPGSFLDWRERSRSFDAISLVRSGPFFVTNRHEPAQITGADVSPNFFRVIGVEPVLGRTFPSTELDVLGHEREIVIGHGLWQRWFGGDPGVLGRSLQIQGVVELRIVGVMPAGFAFPSGSEVWRISRWEESFGRGDRWRQGIGRLKTDVSLDAAIRELRQINEQLAREFPETNAGWSPTVDRLHDAVVGSVRPPLAVLLGAVAVVFLIACVNVATLVVQRGVVRQRERAMRAALGATRFRLARQTFLEHALLGGVGALAGGILAVVMLNGLVALAPAAIPRLDTITIDARVLGYLLLLSLATMTIVGTVPALRSHRTDATATLRGGAGGSAASLGGRGLVVAEVALAVMLLAAAGLMVRTMANLQRLDVGFDPSGVTAVDVRLPMGRMMDGPLRIGSRPAWDRLALFYRDLVQQLEGMPGVQRASVVVAPSLVGRDAVWFARTGVAAPRSNRSEGSPEWRPVQHRAVTPGYFEVLRLPLTRGRPFSDQDHSLEVLRTGKGRRTGVAIVNQVAAEQFWPGASPLGQPLTIEGDSKANGRMVVGVAGDARDLSPHLDPKPTVYVPFAESPDFGATLMVRMAEGAPPVQIRERLRSIDPALILGDVHPLAEAYATALAPRRFITTVLIWFAGAGVLVAAIGLYGLVALSVAQRTREFGIRAALGASWRGLLGMVLREAALVVGVGAALGAVGAAAGVRLLRSQLFAVDALDGLTWAATVLILVVAGVSAAWIPARRAAAVDPAVTLRAE